ncbi:Asp23/Gls24 family envelope stress response protein [Streptomyces sp. JJ36]|uniref:Asp23/Gls24 family envelope stress response protein n=1 Tax=Streptomyces sp. JJ36 TaxID=2736645 RepID=UPI001F1FE5EA|nr:Asp23/Gls24 family envelope stress response protein [Streptomyces sp. JJ36]MCF6524096.1 Asp23/Gls24 family envelope stress response protein [Streptomyces sp. JJ36]
MTGQETRALRDRLAEAAAEAAAGATGVAFLRAGLADVVRGTGLPARRRPAGDAGSAPRSAGVRVRPGLGGGWQVEVQLAVRRGHRALDVTRAVREAVTAAVRREAGPDTGPVAVTLTVTDLA